MATKDKESGRNYEHCQFKLQNYHLGVFRPVGMRLAKHHSWPRLWCFNQCVLRLGPCGRKFRHGDTTTPHITHNGSPKHVTSKLGHFNWPPSNWIIEGMKLVFLACHSGDTFRSNCRMTTSHSFWWQLADLADQSSTSYMITSLRQLKSKIAIQKDSWIISYSYKCLRILMQDEDDDDDDDDDDDVLGTSSMWSWASFFSHQGK